MLPASVLYAVLLMPYTGGGWHIALALFALCDGFTELITLPFRAAFTRNADPLGMAADMLLPAARAGLDIMALPYASARSGRPEAYTLQNAGVPQAYAGMADRSSDRLKAKGSKWLLWRANTYARSWA